MNMHRTFIACFLVTALPLYTTDYSGISAITAVLKNGPNSIDPNTMTIEQKDLAITFFTTLQSLCSTTTTDFIDLALSCTAVENRNSIGQTISELMNTYNMLSDQEEIANLDLGSAPLNAWKNYIAMGGYLYSMMSICAITDDPTHFNPQEFQTDIIGLMNAATRILVIFRGFEFPNGWEHMFDFTIEIFQEANTMCTQVLTLLTQ